MSGKNRALLSAAEAVSGLIANWITSSLIFPLDVVKVRMQVPSSGIDNALTGLIKIAREEGHTSLYKGLQSELVKGGLQTFLYFLAYSALKDLAAASLAKQRKLRRRAMLVSQPQLANHPLFASIASDLIQSIDSMEKESNSFARSLSIASSLSSLSPDQRLELRASLSSCINRRAVSEQLDDETRSLPKARVPLPAVTALLCGYLAGAFSQVFVTPFSVIQTRIMTSKTGGTIFGVMQQLLDNEGPSVLYSGFIPSLILCMNPAIQYFVYDRLKSYLTTALYQRSKPRDPSSLELFLIGAISKITATIITYPVCVMSHKCLLIFFSLHHSTSWQSFECNTNLALAQLWA